MLISIPTICFSQTSFEVNGIRYEKMYGIGNEGRCIANGTTQSTDSLVIPPFVHYQQSDYEVVEIRNFSNGTSYRTDLEYISIPYTVKKIMQSAFYRCSSLKSVSLAEGVEFIGQYAFGDCIGIKNLYIPSTVNNIDYIAFAGCNGLESIEVAEGNPTYDSRDKCNGIILTEENKLIAACPRTTIPAYISTIGRQAYCRSSIEYIIIPEGIEIIEDLAFETCTKLQKVILPNTLRRIGSGAFKGCDIVELHIPNNVTEINMYTWGILEKGNKNLSKITVSVDNQVYDSRDNCNAICKEDTLIAGCNNTVVPNSVSVIGTNAFNGLPLSSVIIPNSVKEIGVSAFSGTSLSKVTIPHSVLTLREWCFSECHDLSSIIIGRNVRTISPYCFYNTWQLQSVTNLSKTPQTIDGTVFYTYGTLHVLPGCKKLYEEVDFWKNFTIIEDAVDEDTPLPYTLSVSDIGYSTLYLDYTATIPNGAKAYVVSDIEEGWLFLSELNENIPACTGVIIEAAEGEYLFEESNNLTPMTSLLEGTLSDIPVSPNSTFVLSTREDIIGFYNYSGSILNSNQAYLKISNGSLPGYYISKQTHIKERFNNSDIQKSSKQYNILGNQLDTFCKGIIIKKGHKVYLQ